MPRRHRTSRGPRLAALVVASLVAGALVPLTAPTTATAAGSATESEQRRIAQHALRTGVTDEDFYFVMADRFANGDPVNDTGGLGDDPQVSGFDPTSRGYYNGGDLAGLLDRLDYIEGLGADSIWLTPSFKNKAVQPEDSSAGYHGYWITDFTQIDPHLGTNDELKALVDAAQARGMKVYFDIITNHTADVIGYTEGARGGYRSKDSEPYRTADGEPFDDRDLAGTGPFPDLDPETSFPYTPVLEPGEEDLKVPGWLNDPTLYHNRGDTTFVGENSQYGDFFGLDDLFTENPRVVQGFLDVYQTWVRDFGIDGFRIDTMKHVNDEFWRVFGPGMVEYARAHGKPEFFMFGEVANDGYDAEDKAFTSWYTTRNQMQAVLDFPFRDAARDFASRSADAGLLGQFFVDDDWYTDADSNAYSLPTFLGNHDSGRFGWNLTTDNPDAAESELLARDRLGHELMYLSRGNPVVYYGDEQGFTGSGGDQFSRQTMFASQVPDYLDDDLLGTESTHAEDNFDPSHPLYRTIRRLDDLTERYPALRDGAQQVRFAADGPGIVAFSRTDAAAQREYVVALNNSEHSSTATVPTFGSTSFRRVYGEGAYTLPTSTDGSLQVTVPPLSAVVYRATERMPASPEAPAITLGAPAPAEAWHSRMHLTADVAGRSFYEVTFQARVAGGPWQTIGTDDSAPFQVFHDTSELRTGTALEYRAAVLDNRRHSRLSDVRTASVPTPEVTVDAPAAGGTVATTDPVTVSATIVPERATQSVRFERRVDGGAWESFGATDSSSPAYLATDDVSDLPLRTQVSYRAILSEPGTEDVVSPETTVTTALPEPARDSVTLAGDLQDEIGCDADWNPACPASALEFDVTDGRWHGTFTLPPGIYQWKVATNGGWTESYGAGGGSGNLELSVPEEGQYRFTWNQTTLMPSVEPVA